jgi:uncharacterized protein (DUF2062 family)
LNQKAAERDDSPLKFTRQLKYYYWRFIRLRGQPNELALGMALGVFTGMMPIVPFQTALAVTLALFLKCSKITAALGTWVSNPLNWYFLYYSSFKIGAFVLGLSEKSPMFSSVMASIQSGEEFMVIVGRILGAGGAFAAAFLLGGFLLGLLVATPTYFVFLKLFRSIQDWRQAKKEIRVCHTPNR